MQRSYIGLLTLVVAVSTSTCKQETQPAAHTALAPELPDAIVPQLWLHEHLDEPKLVIIDARAPAAYEAGHVPGARNLPHQETNNTAPGETHLLAPVQTINRLFSDRGVDMNHTVVVYGDDDYRSAAHLFWVLELHGHTSVGVLNGGFNGWRSIGHAIETETPSWQPQQFTAEFQPDRIVDKLAVHNAISDEQTILLDSRSLDEYHGKGGKEARNGHIPSAQHISARDSLVTEDGVCSVAETTHLNSTYSQLDPDKRIYTYCNTGRRAALNYLILRQLGYDVAVYDGAWREWSADSTLPIER